MQRQRDAEAEQIRQVGIAEEYRKECLRVTEGCGELSAFAAVVDRYPGQDVNLIIDLELHKTALMICSDRGHDQVGIYIDYLFVTFLLQCALFIARGCSSDVARGRC